jgi:hypothetical protein
MHLLCDFAQGCASGRAASLNVTRGKQQAAAGCACGQGQRMRSRHPSVHHAHAPAPWHADDMLLMLMLCCKLLACTDLQHGPGSGTPFPPHISTGGGSSYSGPGYVDKRLRSLAACLGRAGRCSAPARSCACAWSWVSVSMLPWGPGTTLLSGPSGQAATLLLATAAAAAVIVGHANGGSKPACAAPCCQHSADTACEL